MGSGGRRSGLTGFRLRAFDRDLVRVVTDGATPARRDVSAGRQGPHDRPGVLDDLLLGKRLGSTAPGHYEASLLSDGTPVLADVCPETPSSATVGGDPEAPRPDPGPVARDAGLKRTGSSSGGPDRGRRRDSGTALDISTKPRENLVILEATLRA